MHDRVVHHLELHIYIYIYIQGFSRVEFLHYNSVIPIQLQIRIPTHELSVNWNSSVPNFAQPWCTRKFFCQGFLIDVILFHFSWNLVPNSKKHTYNIIKIQFKGLIRWHGTHPFTPTLFGPKTSPVEKDIRSTFQNSMQTLIPSLALC